MDEITAAYNRITGQDGDWNPDVTLDALKDLARAVAANAWDEAKADNNGQRCVCAGEEHRKKFPTWHGRNPYRITEENN